MDRNGNQWMGDEANLNRGSYGRTDGEGTQGGGFEGAQGYGQYPDFYFEEQDFGARHWGEGEFDGERREEGRFFGVGPKGYVRSDERLHEEVCDALYGDPEVDATHIEVSVEGGIVTLKGTVEDRTAKKRAEECAHHVTGVKDVQNQLRLTTFSDPSQMTEKMGYPDRARK